jgi:hypothetical protein
MEIVLRNLPSISYRAYRRKSFIEKRKHVIRNRRPRDDVREDGSQRGDRWGIRVYTILTIANKNAS